MREDFKYPYRVISRKEEIEGNQALGFIIGLILFLPFVLIHKILSFIFPQTVLVFVYIFLISATIAFIAFS
jgi:hypothetical protein